MQSTLKENPKLKYRFTAIYDNGEIFEQHKEDISLTDSKRNSYFDVDHSRLVGFVVVGNHNGTDRAIAVDLRDGHFEIDGNKFTVGNDLICSPRKLYKFMVVNEDREQDTVIGEDLKPRVVATRHTGTRVYFRLGWTGTNEKGEKIERFIEFE